MSEVKGEYLYIMQEREDARANRNLFKFGRTAKDPFMNRFKDYPKCSRWWLIIIVDNATKAETELKRIFKHKFKQRKNDRGDEYYEVDDVQDMMNMVWKYHQEHFENIYIPKVFNGELVFKESMMPLVNHDINDNIVYFRMSDIERTDFTCYLLSNGWTADTKRQILYMNKESYDKFVRNVELKLNTAAVETVETTTEDDNDDTNSDCAVIDEMPEIPIDNEDNNGKKDTLTVSTMSAPRKRGRPPKAKDVELATQTHKTHVDESFPISVEKLGDAFVKHALRRKLCLESTGIRLFVRYNKLMPYIMDIEKVEVYNVNDQNKPLAIFNDTTQLPCYEGQNVSKLLLTQVKMEKLKSVYVESNDQYIIIVEPLVKRRFKPRGKSFISFFPITFVENIED